MMIRFSINIFHSWLKWCEEIKLIEISFYQGYVYNWRIYIVILNLYFTLTYTNKNRKLMSSKK